MEEGSPQRRRGRKEQLDARGTAKRASKNHNIAAFLQSPPGRQARLSVLGVSAVNPLFRRGEGVAGRVSPKGGEARARSLIGCTRGRRSLAVVELREVAVVV